MKDAATLFRALGDELRVKMLWLLLNRPELCVCDFIEVLEIPQPKASQHLRVLLAAGLVSKRKQGLWRFYSLRSKDTGLTREERTLLRKMLAARPSAADLLRRLPERTLGYPVRMDKGWDSPGRRKDKKTMEERS